MGALTDLTAELKTKLRSVQAECSPDDLSQALMDAVRAYSAARPRLTPLTISWSAGQATVDRPEDCVCMEPVAWAALTRPQAAPIQVYDNYVYGRPGRVLGAPSSVPGVTYEVFDGYPAQLVITPTPAAPGSLQFKYYAAHSVTDSACTVPRPDHDLLVKRAIWELWDAISRERGTRPVSFEASGDGNGQRIRMADPDALRKLAENCENEWHRRLGRPLGVMGEMASIEQELLKRLKAFTRSRDKLEGKAGKELVKLYETARKETMERFLSDYGDLEQYELQHIEQTLREIDRLLAPYTRDSADLRTGTIDSGWEIGQRFALDALSVDTAIDAPLAGLQARLGLVDRQMVHTLFGDVPQLAGKVTDDVLVRVRNELVKGVVQGESIPKLARRIAGTGLTQEGLRKPFATLNKRATLIARAEVIKACDAGYEDLARRAQVVIQENIYDLWITAGDDRVDPECRQIARGTHPGYTSVKGYPGVYVGGTGPRPVLSTHPGCRCRRVPVLLRWIKEGLVSLPELKAA